MLYINVQSKYIVEIKINICRVYPDNVLAHVKLLINFCWRFDVEHRGPKRKTILLLFYYNKIVYYNNMVIDVAGSRKIRFDKNMNNIATHITKKSKKKKKLVDSMTETNER